MPGKIRSNLAEASLRISTDVKPAHDSPRLVDVGVQGFL